MKITITITGASGFVGSNLLPYLQNAGYTTIGVSRNPRVNEFSYEELTTETWNNANAIIHLAGKAHDLKKVSNSEEYYEANFELTKQLFDAFLNSKASVFIFMSSVKAVADEVNGVLDEDNSPNPKTHYGISKLQAEQYILSKEIPEGKRVYILRPCMIHGPGNKGNLNLLYKMVAKGIPWPLGAFENKRSYCSIDNVCFIIKELLEREDIPSGIYHMADDDALSTNEMIQLIAASQNLRPRIWKLPKSMIKNLARLGDLFHLSLNTERLQKLTESYQVSNNKIKVALEKPLPISSKDGLIKTFQSFK